MCAPRVARRTMYRDVVRKRLRVRRARKCVSRVVRRVLVLLTDYPKRPLSLRLATQPTGKRRLEVTRAYFQRSCRSRTCGWMRRRRGGGGGSADGRWGCLCLLLWGDCGHVLLLCGGCGHVLLLCGGCGHVLLLCGDCGHVLLLLCGGCGHVLLLCGGCGHVLLLCGGCGHVVWRLWPFRTSQGWVGGIKNTRRPRGTRAGPSPLRPTHRTCEHVGMAPTRRPFVKNREQMLDADAGARRK